MILVLFGTPRGNFERLAKAVETYALSFQEEIIVQLGTTRYVPKGVKWFRFVSHESLKAYIQRAEVVVAHGGFATLGECLELRKRIVAVPRRNDFGESVDSGLGQLEIVRQFEAEGRLVAVYDEKELPQAIERARQMKPCFTSNTLIPGLVLDFVRSVLGAPPA